MSPPARPFDTSTHAVAVRRPRARIPVIVSVPHAGRVYPPEILAASRVDRAALERLEDAWVDRIAAPAIKEGATIVEAVWARAVADCNRGESQMAPGEVAPELRLHFTAPGRKERAGLGVVPTRLAGCGALWRAPIDRAAFEWRLDRLHRPFHAAVAREAAALRARFGYALLIDLHSMPPIPRGQPGHGASMVIGDRFGVTCGGWMSDCVEEWAARIASSVTRNRPYAGGHVVRTHGSPSAGVHALQIEIDRTLYLNADGTPDSARIDRLAAWFQELVGAVAEAGQAASDWPAAAE